jgi:hypothetical protein
LVGKPFRFARKKTPRKQRKFVSFGGENVFPGIWVIVEAEHRPFAEQHRAMYYVSWLKPTQSIIPFAEAASKGEHSVETKPKSWRSCRLELRSRPCSRNDQEKDHRGNDIQRLHRPSFER